MRDRTLYKRQRVDPLLETELIRLHRCAARGRGLPRQKRRCRKHRYSAAQGGAPSWIEFTHDEK
jgi:hypothetical protein